MLGTAEIRSLDYIGGANTSQILLDDFTGHPRVSYCLYIIHSLFSLVPGYNSKIKLFECLGIVFILLVGTAKTG